MCKNCVLLENLQIQCDETSDLPINLQIAEALTYTKRLKDLRYFKFVIESMFERTFNTFFFRYRNPVILFSGIFGALTKCAMIERVWLESHTISDLTLDQIQPFLKTAHNLILFGLDVNWVPKPFQELLASYEKLHPARFFTTDGTSRLMEMPVFLFEGFIRERLISQISMGNPYKEFIDF